MKTTTNSNPLPHFSFKSAFLIMIAAIIGGLFLPLMAESLGMNGDIVNVFGLSICISFATAFARCFIESELGFGKTFWKTFGLFVVFTTIIAYFWVYQNLYM